MNRSGIDANEFVAHRSSGALPLNYLQRYGLAVVSIGVALGISLLLQHFGFRVPSALLLLFAVAISSWYAGAGPAVLAAILSTISFYWYFVEPVHTIYISRSQIPYFVIFTAFAALLSRFGTFRQRAEADLRRTHDQLKVERPKLGSRTIALLYFAFSSCWILFTDRLVHGLGLSNAYLLKVSEAKGILFISLSTLLMYVLVEKALRQRHSVAAAYWQLVETAQEGVWSVDAEGRTVFANENMAAILGTSPGEMIGKSILPFVPQEKKDELLNHLLQREQGLQEHYEFPFLRADGAQVWALLRVSPVLRDGQHSGCLALVSDITERKHAEEALRRLNRELRAISNCNQALLRATDEKSLLEEICRIVCEEAGYRMAWVSYAEHDEVKSVRPVAWTGAEEGYLASAGITWADTDRGRSPTGTAIRSGKSCCIQDFAKDPRLAPWREGLLQRGFRSGIALPLKDENDNAFGSLTIHSAQPNAFTSEEVRLLEELAGDLAFGIVTLRSRAARKQAEQALRQSEAYLAETQRLTHTCTFVTDDSTKPLYWSEELFRIFGFDPDHGLPTLDQLLQRIHPEDRDKFWKAFQKATHEKVDSDVEFRIVLPDGTVKHAYRLDHPVLNADGELVEVLGTTVDITERKRAEEEVRNTAAQWQATFDAVQDLVLLLDKDFRVLRANHAAAEFLGLPFDKIVGGHCYELTHGTPTSPAECPLAKMRQSRTHEEAELLAREGGPWLSVSVDPVFDPSGELIQVVHVARDMTERKRAEEALREGETRFRTFVDHAGDALFVQDLEQGTIVDLNQAACESLGYTRQELIGNTAVAFHLDSDRAEMESAAERAAAGETVVGTHRHRRKDGSVFPVEANTSSFWYGGRRFLLHVSRDISDRVRAEEVRLEERVRERTRIARELHDTLLQSFHGTLLHFQAASSLLPTRTAEAKRMLDSAIDMAAQAITEGRDAIQGLRSPEVEINDLAVAIRTFGESYAADRGDDGSPVFQVELVGVARELDPTFAGEVYRIAIEALRNSFQHAEARHIKVEIHHEEKEFRVLVRDDGKGIDSKSLGAEGLKGHYGLHGMRERAKLIGSEIVIRSEVGAGTEVELRVAAITAYAPVASS